MVVLQAITFVDGSELESHVGISLVLSEVRERWNIVIQNGWVVVIQQVISWQLGEIPQMWELPLQMIQLILLWEKLEEISRPNHVFSFLQNVAELPMDLVKTIDVFSDVSHLSD